MSLPAPQSTREAQGSGRAGAEHGAQHQLRLDERMVRIGTLHSRPTFPPKKPNREVFPVNGLTIKEPQREVMPLSSWRTEVASCHHGVAARASFTVFFVSECTWL